MLRILHVIPSISPLRGGPSHAILGIVRKLNSQNVKCEIATTDDDGPGRVDVPLESLTQFGGCPVRFFRRWKSVIPALREFTFSWPLTMWLKENVTRYDVVHIHALFSYPSTIAMYLARRANVPYLVRPLGLLCEWSLRQKPIRKRVYLDLIERCNLNGASALEFSTPEEQREAAPLQLKPPSVIFPLGFELQEKMPDARRRLRSKLGISDDSPVIVFLSRLHPKKGLHLLLQALARLKRLRFIFVIAGAGEKGYEQEIDGLIASLGLIERVKRLGFVNGEEKAIALQGADIFALTSHSESFGIAVAEAMAAELPVLITPGVPLAPVVAKHDLGWVVDLNDEKIAEAIAIALLNPERAKIKGRRGAEYARKHYIWNAFASRLADVYLAISTNNEVSRFDE
jgi:glycosyltransferase involved in cell wall biosynthesis